MKSWRSRTAAAALIAAAAVVPLTASTASAAASPSGSFSAAGGGLWTIRPIGGTWGTLAECEAEKAEFAKQNTTYMALYCIQDSRGAWDLWGLPF
ncbi:hypothetical protein [Streptomyces sp. YIM B13518]|uniref:hypothetical protein n=1 Tax=Streptomyces sp. YIM B13518 TaxID=3366316 RepID=UPI00369F8410